MTEIPVVICSLKLNILSLASSKLDKTFWGVKSAAVDKLRCTKMIANGLEHFWGLSPENLKHKKIWIQYDFEQW